MELHNLSMEDVRAFDQAKLRETEQEIRKQMAVIRMDIYATRGKHTAASRGLRRSLARLLTVTNAGRRRHS